MSISLVELEAPVAADAMLAADMRAAALKADALLAVRPGVSGNRSGEQRESARCAE